ncbi:nucleoside triphosphate pyrophosphohydrolase family protein [Paraburkholderia azotifigens]|uniref:nucleoside triphosphate pyrophosphohydrolase family protein n=1 Tax=Paraburkholderia azotifigens TaxID=2057004 RepID=UPI003180C02F
MVERTNERPSRAVSLMGLVGEVGDLHSMMKKLLLQKDNPLFRTELREEFGDLLWYLTSLASLYEIPLAEIAKANAEKAESLYSEGSVNVFDSGFAPDERLPRRFVVNFYEKPLERSLYVKVSVNDVVIGDALTDNSHEDDGYRYHDVFHLAYAAVLGWSPVCRSLLKCKRKSNAKIDEVEDGARAAVIEEAVSILVFNQAEERGWYVDRSSIDIGLLKTIRRMVTGLEVRTCTAKQWQLAICQGYAVFRELKRNGGGDVTVDLDKQRITYRVSPPTKGVSSIAKGRRA